MGASEVTSERSRRRPVVVAGAVLAAAVLLAAGLLLGSLLAPDQAAADPQEGSVDVGFSRDMREHHAQAVEMSVLVRDVTDDPQVRTLALDIMLTQQQQLGQMYGWLAAWGLPQTSASPPMRWMTPDDAAAEGMPGMDGPSHGAMDTKAGAGLRMPGMASDEQLAALAQAAGRRAERIYLQLMIPHHRAGVQMAQYAVQYARQPQVRRLARNIVDSQTSEIAVLREMLAARGGPVAGL